MVLRQLSRLCRQSVARIWQYWKVGKGKQLSTESTQDRWNRDTDGKKCLTSQQPPSLSDICCTSHTNWSLTNSLYEMYNRCLITTSECSRTLYALTSDNTPGSWLVWHCSPVCIFEVGCRCQACNASLSGMLTLSVEFNVDFIHSICYASTIELVSDMDDKLF